jgi:hypothetical protein
MLEENKLFIYFSLFQVWCNFADWCFAVVNKNIYSKSILLLLTVIIKWVGILEELLRNNLSCLVLTNCLVITNGT